MNLNKEVAFGFLLGLLLGALVLSLKFAAIAPETGATSNSSMATSVEVETGSGLPETL